MEPVFAIVLVGALVVISYFWQSSRSDAIIRQWAQDSGYTLLGAEYRTFRRGPFFMTGNRGQTVYYVTVVDNAGVTRRGWVRCGGCLLGLLSDQIEVAWDD